MTASSATNEFGEAPRPKLVPGSTVPRLKFAAGLTAARDTQQVMPAKSSPSLSDLLYDDPANGRQGFAILASFHRTIASASSLELFLCSVTGVETRPIAAHVFWVSQHGANCWHTFTARAKSGSVQTFLLDTLKGGRDQDLEKLVVAETHDEMTDALAAVRKRLLAGDEVLADEMFSRFERSDDEMRERIIRSLLTSKLPSTFHDRLLSLSHDALAGDSDTIKLAVIAAAAYLRTPMKRKIATIARARPLSDRIERALNALEKTLA